MADDKEVEKRKIRSELGEELNKAIPMFEDPTRYPIEELVELARLQMRMMHCEDGEKRQILKGEFREKRESIRLLPHAPERIWLWQEGRMPVQTVYTENPGYFYDHEPDFRPYMLELPPWENHGKAEKEGAGQRGAVLLVAGGTHGAGTINECYQTGLELNELGYQCFIVQCRPNRNPWNGYEVGADCARALRIVRSRAERYGIDPEKIAMGGFSNGGLSVEHCIAYYSGHKKVSDYFPEYQEDALDSFYGSPDAYLCIYGARHVGTEYDYDGVVYPPTFIAVGREDVPGLDNANFLYADLVQRKIPVEIHTFAGHPHGFAGWKIMDKTGYPNFDLWVRHADVFLRDAFSNRHPRMCRLSLHNMMIGSRNLKPADQSPAVG